MGIIIHVHNYRTSSPRKCLSVFPAQFRISPLGGLFASGVFSSTWNAFLGYQWREARGSKRFGMDEALALRELSMYMYVLYGAVRVATISIDRGNCFTIEDRVMNKTETKRIGRWGQYTVAYGARVRAYEAMGMTTSDGSSSCRRRGNNPWNGMCNDHRIANGIGRITD